MTQALKIGDVFRDMDGVEYLILEVLGEGNMAIVYLACPPSLPLLRYAIKVVKFPEPFSREVQKEFLRCFERERQIMQQVGRLGHPNIAALYSAGTAKNGLPYIILEKLEGETLHARLSRSPAMAFSEALPITLQIGEALAAIHSLDIVHRDLSTRNVFLCATSTFYDSSTPLVKLIDFGVAKFAGMTLHPGVYGSPAYMSPEQAAGNSSIDVRADQFALAALLLEMLTGQPLFADPEENAQQVLLRVQKEDASFRIAALPIPRPAQRALTQALHKDPKQRFRSVEDFLTALQAKDSGPKKADAAPRPPVKTATPSPPLPGVLSYLFLALCVSLCGTLTYRLSVSEGRASPSSARTSPPIAAVKNPPEKPAAPATLMPVKAVPPAGPAPLPAKDFPTAPITSEPPKPQPPVPSPVVPPVPRLVAPILFSKPKPVLARAPVLPVRRQPGSAAQTSWRAEPRFGNKSVSADVRTTSVEIINKCLGRQQSGGRLPAVCKMTLLRSASQEKYFVTDPDCEIRSTQFAMSLELCVSDGVRSKSLDPPPDSFSIQVYSGALP